MYYCSTFKYSINETAERQVDDKHFNYKFSKFPWPDQLAVNRKISSILSIRFKNEDEARDLLATRKTKQSFTCEQSLENKITDLIFLTPRD